MGWIIGCWRRFFGGYDSKFDILEKRGIQCIFLIGLIFCWELFVKDFSAIKSIIIAVSVYFFFCKSHYYYFKCGTESDEYIDEQEAKGRKPAMNWIVKPVNKMIGFKPRSKQYCFVGMFLRYFLCSLPAAVFVGWQFAICGFVVPFIYNAMFWVDLPKTKLSSGPTGYAEFFTGLIIGWALL